MREKYPAEFENSASVFTIHNFAYQGEFGTDILDAFGLQDGHEVRMLPNARASTAVFKFERG